MMFWEPSKVITSYEKRWFVTFIDDHTRLTSVVSIFDKSEVTSTFWEFYHTIETQFSTTIAIPRSDNDSEFQNHSLNEFLSSQGIVHQNSCAYMPNKMGLPSKRTTFWKLYVPLCYPHLFLPISRVTSFSLQLISSTACLPVFFTSRHR